MLDTWSCREGPQPDHLSGYLKAVWPGFWGAFLKSGRPRGPGKALKNVRGFAPHILEGFPGPPGPARLKKTPQKSGQTAFRYPARRDQVWLDNYIEQAHKHPLPIQVAEFRWAEPAGGRKPIGGYLFPKLPHLTSIPKNRGPLTVECPKIRSDVTRTDRA